ncbi:MULTISPECIES: hypothetical protein [Rodentibacter]|uniref:Uncharacterized protein n=3 Tax=Rodentibacter TaxID=1960084 RepID=A0A1V3LCF6_9PAST|nr:MULTISPECIES: hypothetical protein [Rodentibacter]OOF44237.1 hypothetical protein BKK51_09515 [Rodentibacter trehalosifermentans]OOF87799.1 hypothetical protein BKG88_00955 [Rodentibacter ratti]OOF88329.1 hypothetical protein BKG94_07295 [Rodentibacter ratti]TGZ98307.1 hypothetical protein D3M72_10875 [Rodentibacter pneumotropicus]
MNSKTSDKLTAICERGLYDQMILNNQILAIAGEPENIQDDVLRHQIIVCLHHSQCIEQTFKQIKKVAQNEHRYE